MALLTQTVTTETAINWEELAQKIRKNESGLRVGDIITEQTKDGEELDLVVVDMGPGWARFESKDCLPLEVPYNQNGRNAGGFAESGVKWHLDNTVFTSLPEELQAVISEIERTQEGGKTYRCQLFLPTESEVFGDCNYSGDDTYPQIEYYKDRRHRIKCNRKGGGERLLDLLRACVQRRGLDRLGRRQRRALRAGLLRNSVIYKIPPPCAAR